LNSTVDLVLFAMGGNDMQFENLVKKCLIFGLRVASDCQNQIDFVRNNAATWTQQLSNALIAMHPLLKPTARVIVLQFPHIVLNTPFTFSEIFGGGSIEITNNLRSLGSVLDDGQRNAVAMANQAANRTFVLYYDQVKAVFEGHEPHPSAFSDNANGWVYEGSAPITVEIYHLNPIGHTQLASALYKYVVPLVPPITAPVSLPVSPVSTPVMAAPLPTPVVFSPVAPPVNPDPTTIAPVLVEAPTRNGGGFLSALFRFLFGWLF
jgi:lysophospholipase L1-like esterase